MDDLVVIILMLIIAGFGAIGQIKKKKADQRQPQSTGKQPDDIWDMLLKQREGPVQVTEPYPEYFKEPKSILETFETPVYEFNPYREGTSALKDRIVPKKPVLQTRKKIKQDFSLKKAVIYSEILNRKYI